MKRSKTEARGPARVKAKAETMRRKESARASTKNQTAGAALAPAGAKAATSSAETTRRAPTRARTGVTSPPTKPKAAARVKRPKVAEGATAAPRGDDGPTGPALYDRDAIVDAPEHHGRAQAFGTLTWTTWDADPRPVGLRVDDFVAAFPPHEPHRFVGGNRVRDEQGTFQPGDAASRAARFLATDGARVRSTNSLRATACA
jgi:hypothetical protein